MRSAFQRPFLSRWVFDVEIIARMMSFRRSNGLAPAAAAIYEFPLPRWHDAPGSKLRPGDYFLAARDLFRIWRSYPLWRGSSSATSSGPAARVEDEAALASAESAGYPAESK
jgi:hypothetical protein